MAKTQHDPLLDIEKIDVARAILVFQIDLVNVVLLLY